MAAVKECDICLENYNNDRTDHCPIFLKCGHDLCISCVKNIYSKLGFVKCPSCQAQFSEDPNNSEEAKSVYVTAFSLIPDENFGAVNPESMSPTTTTTTTCVFKKCESQHCVTFCKHCDRYLCQSHYQQDKLELIQECQPHLEEAMQTLSQLKNIKTCDVMIKDLENRHVRMLQIKTMLEKLESCNIDKLKRVKQLKKEQLDSEKSIKDILETLEIAVNDDKSQSNTIYENLKLLKNAVKECEAIDFGDMQSKMYLSIRDDEANLYEFVSLCTNNPSKYWSFSGSTVSGKYAMTNAFCYLKIHDIEELLFMIAAGGIMSPNFYTRDWYNFRIGVETVRNVAPDHVGLFIGISPGKHDAHLKWPYPNVLTAEFVSNKEDHMKQDSAFVFCTEAVWNSEDFNTFFSCPQRKNNFSRGDPALIEKKMLLSDCYMTDKAVSIKVQCGFPKNSTIYFTEQILSDVSQNNQHQNVYIWKMGNVSLKKLRKYPFFSPAFTVKDGHKFVMQVYLNGDGATNEGFISIYTFIVKSEQDINLTWPFVAKVKLELIDIILNKGPYHVIEYATADAESMECFRKPTTDRNPALGRAQLIKIKAAFDCNRYIDGNDNIHFKFSVL